MLTEYPFPHNSPLKQNGIKDTFSPNSPDISICIPTLNEESNLPSSLHSLNRRVNELSGDIGVETVVADGGSEDDTLNIAKKHPSVNHVINVERDGILPARDAAIRQATGDIIVQVDADAVYDKNWLTNLLIPFNYKNVVMTYGEPKGRGLEYLPREIFTMALKTAYGCYASGANRAFLRDAYFKVGGYNLSTNQSKADCFIEEEIQFVKRMANLGLAVYVHNAVSRQSGRNLEAFLDISNKKGGTTWDILKN